MEYTKESKTEISSYEPGCNLKISLHAFPSKMVETGNKINRPQKKRGESNSSEVF